MNTETVTLRPAVIRHIANLTDQNDHGGAMAAGAKAIGCDDLAELFTDIRQRHIKVGYLTDALEIARRDAYNRLMDEARKRLDPATFNRFYGSF